MSKRRVSFAPEATLHTFELVESAPFTESQVPQPVRKRDSGINKELASIFSNVAAEAASSSAPNSVSVPETEQQQPKNDESSRDNEPKDNFHKNNDESDMELESTADIFAATKATIMEYESRDGNDSPKPLGNTITTIVPTSMSIETFADGLGDASRRESNTQQSEVEFSGLELAHQENHSHESQPVEEERTMDMTQMFGSVKKRVEMESRGSAATEQVEHLVIEEQTMQLTNMPTVPSANNDDVVVDMDLTGNIVVPAEEEMDFTNVVNTKLPAEDNGLQEMDFTTVSAKHTNNDDESDMDFTTIPSKIVTAGAHNEASGSGENNGEQDMDFTTVSVKPVQPVSAADEEQDMDFTTVSVKPVQPVSAADEEQDMDFTTVSVKPIQPVSAADEEQDMDLTTYSTGIPQPASLNNDQEKDMDLTAAPAASLQPVQEENDEVDMDFTTTQKTGYIPTTEASNVGQDDDNENDINVITVQKGSEEDDMDFTHISRQNDGEADMDLTNVLELAAEDDLSEVLRREAVTKTSTVQKQSSPKLLPSKLNLSPKPHGVATPERNTKENQIPNGSLLRNQPPDGISYNTASGSLTKRKSSLSLQLPNLASTPSPAQNPKSGPATPNRITHAAVTPTKRSVSYNSVSIGSKKRRVSISTTPERSLPLLSLADSHPPLTPSKMKLLEDRILSMSPRKTHSRPGRLLEAPASSSASFVAVEPYLSDTLTSTVTYTPLSRMRKDSLGVAAPRLSLVTMSPTPKKSMDNYTVLSRVSEGDEEEEEEPEGMDDYPLVSLTEFLKNIKVDFMDNLFLNNSTLHGTHALFNPAASGDTSTWKLKDYVYATTKIPRLEMYTFSIHEMRKNIAEARLLFDQLDQETREETNPLLFREFLEAGPEMKQAMIAQFKLIKHYSRLHARGVWYDWRLQLTSGLQDALARRRQVVEDDHRLLNDRARAANMAALRVKVTQQHAAMKARLDMLRRQTVELDKYDKKQVDAMRGELVAAKRAHKDAASGVEQQRARVAELDTQLVKVAAEREALEQEVETFRQAIARNQTDERDIRREVGVLTRRYSLLQAHSGVEFVNTDAATKSIIVLKLYARFIVHYEIKAKKTISVESVPVLHHPSVNAADSKARANETAILTYFLSNPALRDYTLQQTAMFLQAVLLFQVRINRLSLYYPTLVALEGNGDDSTLIIEVKILHYPSIRAGSPASSPPPKKKVIVRLVIASYDPASFSSCSLQTCYPRPAAAPANGGAFVQLTERLNGAFGGPDPAQFLSALVQSTA
jgi:kinetochore protein Spc7/SPC105